LVGFYSLGFMVFWVGHRPHLQDRLHAEMEEIFGRIIGHSFANLDYFLVVPC
jgi:hypothetical protein